MADEASEPDERRGRTDKRRRKYLLDRVSFFEQVWFGRNRSPSIERGHDVLNEDSDPEDLQQLQEQHQVQQQNETGVDTEEVEEKRRRRNSGSPDRYHRQLQRRNSKNDGNKTDEDDDWEWVESSGDSGASLDIAEDIERRLEERRAAANRQRKSPKWPQLRRSPIAAHRFTRDTSPSPDAEVVLAITSEDRSGSPIRHVIHQQRPTPPRSLPAPLEQHGHSFSLDKPRSRTSSIHRSRLQSRTPSVERILEEDEVLVSVNIPDEEIQSEQDISSSEVKHTSAYNNDDSPFESK
ncbi:unnamed protein product, partial [Meganyctiphanes norvegica]